MVFSGMKHRIEEYEKREKRQKIRRGGLRCGMLSSTVLSCAVDNISAVRSL